MNIDFDSHAWADILAESHTARILVARRMAENGSGNLCERIKNKLQSQKGLIERIKALREMHFSYSEQNKLIDRFKISNKSTHDGRLGLADSRRIVETLYF